jgi:hypothetical protein
MPMNPPILDEPTIEGGDDTEYSAEEYELAKIALEGIPKLSSEGANQTLDRLPLDIAEWSNAPNVKSGEYFVFYDNPVDLSNIKEDQVERYKNTRYYEKILNKDYSYEPTLDMLLPYYLTNKSDGNIKLEKSVNGYNYVDASINKVFSDLNHIKESLPAGLFNKFMSLFSSDKPEVQTTQKNTGPNILNRMQQRVGPQQYNMGDVMGGDEKHRYQAMVINILFIIILVLVIIIIYHVYQMLYTSKYKCDNVNQSFQDLKITN